MTPEVADKMKDIQDQVAANNAVIADTEAEDAKEEAAIEKKIE